MSDISNKLDELENQAQSSSLKSVMSDLDNGGSYINSEIAAEYVEKGNELVRSGNIKNLEKAVDFYLAAVRLDPKNSNTANALINGFISAGDWLFDVAAEKEKAVVQYKKAVEFRPDNSQSRQRLQIALDEIDFQSKIKKGNPTFYVGTAVEIDKSKVIAAIKQEFDRGKYFGFNFCEKEVSGFPFYSLIVRASETIDKCVSDLIAEKHKETMDWYDACHDGRWNILSEDADNSLGSTGLRVASAKIGESVLELRPYAVVKSEAESLYKDRDCKKKNSFSIGNLKNLKSDGKVIRPLQKEEKGPVYYSENYVVPVEIQMNHAVNKKVWWTYGFRKYSAFFGHINANLCTTVKGNLIYNGQDLKLLDQELTGVDAVVRNHNWVSEESYSPFSRFVYDVVKGAIIGSLIMLPPGGCVGGCGELLGGTTPVSEYAIGAMKIGAVIGGIIGMFTFLCRDSSDIRNLHHRWRKELEC